MTTIDNLTRITVRCSRCNTEEEALTVLERVEIHMNEPSSKTHRTILPKGWKIPYPMTKYVCPNCLTESEK